MKDQHVTDIEGFDSIDGADGLEWGQLARRAVCSCGYRGQWTTLEQALDDRWLHETLSR
jgi:hypothetical protein